MGRSAIVVLGMHRSGTSSVAGALSMLGAAPPRTLMSPAQDNPRGFWESVVLADFNDRLLTAGGSRWDDPRPFDLAAVSGVDGFAQEAAHLLRAEFDDQSLIVMKDPRVCRLFPFWGEVLEATGHDVAVVSPLRDPAEVAASLTRRNGFPPRQGLGLWLRHVLDAEAASRGRPRVFLPWSDFLADWRGLRTRSGRGWPCRWTRRPGISPTRWMTSCRATCAIRRRARPATIRWRSAPGKP
ncbi:hypothetical protein MU852_06915 [Brevundimonas albigilva]|uniref:sulfotransferase family protein n=1 Tax=Brevundimonas albigilva TaxID=1312364 RepID=UPI00201B87A8|nr:hypothetical protein [Brevundimonas albigilva]UQV19489.1 hypothetical protein MU852_06915 [Brevundimonas albigilva]